MKPQERLTAFLPYGFPRPPTGPFVYTFASGVSWEEAEEWVRKHRQEHQSEHGTELEVCSVDDEVMRKLETSIKQANIWL